MKVYIAEQGCYEQRGVAGIFDSPERAMAVMPGERWTRTLWVEWVPNGSVKNPRGYYEEWSNELDWDDAVSIRAMELTADGALRQPDVIQRQTYRTSDGGWDYPEITAEEADYLIAMSR